MAREDKRASVRRENRPSGRSEVAAGEAISRLSGEQRSESGGAQGPGRAQELRG